MERQAESGKDCKGLCCFWGSSKGSNVSMTAKADEERGYWEGNNLITHLRATLVKLELDF